MGAPEPVGKEVVVESSHFDWGGGIRHVHDAQPAIPIAHVIEDALAPRVPLDESLMGEVETLTIRRWWNAADPLAAGPEDVYTQLVFSARAADVRLVLVGGKLVVEDGQLIAFSEADAVADAERQRILLVNRLSA